MRRLMRAAYRALCLLNDILSVVSGTSGRRYKNKMLGRQFRRLFR